MHGKSYLLVTVKQKLTKKVERKGDNVIYKKNKK